MEALQNSDEWKYAGKQQKLIAAFGGNLFILTRPGLILCTPASNLLSTQNAEKPVKKLKYDGDFEVLHMHFSSDGKLLCLQGRNAVSVLVVPSILGKDAILTTMKIGEFELSTDIENPIVKALWHPLSRNGTHLCVVSTNGIIRFDSLSMPESKYRLHQSMSPRKGFNLAADLDVVSATFGYGYGWLPMTLFLLLRNGDVMSISPLIPRHGSINKRVLEQLVEECESKLQTVESIFSIDLENCRIDFVRDLQSSSISSGDSLNGRLNFTSPKMANYDTVHDYSIVPQGPYRLIPTPSTSLDHAIEASDISFIIHMKAVGDKTWSVPCIMIAYNGGFVDACILDTDDSAFGPLWDGTISRGNQDEPSLAPSLWVLESLDLQLLELEQNDREIFTPRLEIFSAFPDIYFLMHSSGLHYIYVSSAITNFASSLSSPDDLVQFSRALGSRNIIQVGGVLSTRQHADLPPNAVTAIAAWTEALVKPYLIGTSDSDEIFMEHLDALQPVKFARNAPKHNDILLDRSNLTESTTLLREIPITRDFPFISRTADSVEVSAIIPNMGKVVVSDKDASKPYPECINKTTYEIMGKETGKLRDHIKYLQQLLAVFKTRMDLIEKQEELIEKEFQGVYKSEEASNILRRLEVVSKRQAKLEKRMDLCINIAMELSAPSLSQAEIEWSQELKSHERQVKDLKGKYTQLKAMITLLNTKLEKLGDTSKPGQKAWTGTYQLRNITSIVEKEAEFLGDLKNKVKELEAKVDFVDGAVE